MSPILLLALLLQAADAPRSAGAVKRLQDENLTLQAKPGIIEEGNGLPWIDFERAEVGVRAGLNIFSKDFESPSTTCTGLFARVPVPLFGVEATEPNPPEENPFAWGYSDDPPKAYVGIFTEILFSSIDRDFAAPPGSKLSGSVMFIAAGIDVALLHTGPLLLRAQVGGQRGSFGGVVDTQDGFAAMYGLAASYRLGRGFVLTYNPHYNTADAGDHIWFHMIGIEKGF